MPPATRPMKTLTVRMMVFCRPVVEGRDLRSFMSGYVLSSLVPTALLSSRDRRPLSWRDADPAPVPAGRSCKAFAFRSEVLRTGIDLSANAPEIAGSRSLDEAREIGTYALQHLSQRSQISSSV
jgi:hypothetical protein